MRLRLASLVLFCSSVAALAGMAVLGMLLITFGRPPQPLRLGTIQWFYEVGVTVDSVERVAQVGTGRNVLRAKGVYYIVHARMLAPFGLRPTWHDSDVEVRTFAHTGATRPPMRFSVDGPAQSLLDEQTGRPGPVHEVRGASRHEDLIFDLPRDVEQPALVFLPANDPAGALAWLFLRPWQPHRFNLRYD